MMESDRDLRAKALIDQLNEIDQRIVEVTGRPLTNTERVVRLVLFGVLLILLALSASTLEQLGIGLALPVTALVVGGFLSGPLIGIFRKRKLERDRDRVLALYQEMDRRLRPSPGDPEEAGGVN